MENVVLTIHLILAVFLIGVVLLQRSEGGALFGGGGGVVSGRGAATALSKVTWGLAAAFIATSLILTILAARDAARDSLLDRVVPGTEGVVPMPLPPATDSVPAPTLPPGPDAPAPATAPAPAATVPVAPAPAQ